MLFYTQIINSKFELRDNLQYDLKKLEKLKNVVLLSDEKLKKLINVPIIQSKNPRLDFQQVVMEFFVDDEYKPGIHPTAIIEKASSIGKNVFIGAHCYIGNKVKIGDNSKIFANTTIYGESKIGSNSVILSNSSIGVDGFSFSYAGKELFHFPSLGSIIIGDNVWIGPNCVVEKAQIDATIIESHAKIDESVQIGHNVIIKKFAQITAGSIICGRVKIGERCWIAPNSVIVGSPAKFLKKMYKNYNGK